MENTEMESLNEDQTGEFLDQFRLLQTLGKGGNAIVRLAEGPDGSLYAIKIPFQYNLKIADEIGIQDILKHPNIIKLVSFSLTGQYINYDLKSQISDMCYIVMEKAQDSLFTPLSLIGRGFSPNTTRFYLKQILDGLEFIHSSGYTHLDIKPENILLDDKFNLKITDFGFAERLDKVLPVGFDSSCIGTALYYSPPELLKGQRYNGVQVDCFALGVTLFIMATGVPPFLRADKEDVYYRYILANNFQTFWSIYLRGIKNSKTILTKELIEILTSLFHPDPQLRMSIADIRASAYYNQPHSTYEQVVQEMTKIRQFIEKQNNISANTSDSEVSVGGAGGQYKSIGKSQKFANSDRKIQKYSPNNKVLTEIYINEFAESILERVDNFLYENKITYKISDQSYEIEADQTIEDLSLKFIVTIFDVDSTNNKYAIQFSRISGDIFQFSRLFNEFKKTLVGDQEEDAEIIDFEN